MTDRRKQSGGDSKAGKNKKLELFVVIFTLQKVESTIIKQTDSNSTFQDQQIHLSECFTQLMLRGPQLLRCEGGRKALSIFVNCIKHVSKVNEQALLLIIRRFDNAYLSHLFLLIVDNTEGNINENNVLKAVWYQFYSNTNEDYILSSFFGYLFQLKDKSGVLEFMISNPDILITFITRLIQNLKLGDKTTDIKTLKKLKYCRNILTAHTDLFDIDILDFFVQTLHSTILNCISSTKEIRCYVYEIYEMLDHVFFEADDLVACANIDKILQHAIEINDIDFQRYISFLKSKSTDIRWVTNSILSLESLLFRDMKNIAYSSSSSTNTNWDQFIQYLKVFDMLLQENLMIEKPLLRLLFDKILITNKLIIPKTYHDEVVLHSCRIVTCAYQSDNVPFDHIKFFQLFLSYATYSIEPTLRMVASEALIAIVEWDPTSTSSLFKEEKIESVKHIITHSTNTSKYYNLTKKIYDLKNDNIDSWNFIELIYLFANFESTDMKVLLNYQNLMQINYPKKLKTQLASQLETILSFDGFETPFPRFPEFVKKLFCFNDFNSFREDFTPLYPAPSKLEIKIYAFIVLISLKKKFVDSDIMIADMFRYTDEDIMFAFGEIFNTYTIPTFILKGLVKELSKGNDILLNFIIESPSLISSFKISDLKFDLFKMCMRLPSEKFVTFVRLILTIMNESSEASLKVFPPVERNDGQFYALLRSCESSYLNWSASSRIRFWESCLSGYFSGSKYSVDTLIVLITRFLTSLKGNSDYVFINDSTVITLSKKFFDNATDDQLDSYLSKKMKELKMLKSNSKGENKSPQNYNDNKQKDDVAGISKTQDIRLADSNETIKVLIEVFPNGRKVNSLEGADEDDESLKKLTHEERRFYFKEKRKATKNREVKSKIVNYSDHFISIIVDDLFKGIFNKKKSIGKLIGSLFYSSVNFSKASDTQIAEVLSAFHIKKNKDNLLAMHLYVTFCTYLKKRKLLTPELQKLSQKAQQMTQLI